MGLGLEGAGEGAAEAAGLVVFSFLSRAVETQRPFFILLYLYTFMCVYVYIYIYIYIYIFFFLHVRNISGQFCNFKF